jgi:hypothetical protein
MINTVRPPGICFAALSLGMLFTSCSKSGTTVWPGTASSAAMSYSLRITNAAAELAQKAVARSSLQWTSGLAYPGLIKFEAKQNTSEIEYKSTNSIQVDLFSPMAIHFGTFTLPTGTYNEVELKMQFDKSGAKPALQLNGLFSKSTGGTTPVTLIVDESLELKTETQNVSVDSNTFDAITTLDLSAFTQGITESMLQAAQLSGSTLIISSASNRDIYQIILNNLRSRRHHLEVEHHH